MKNRNGFTLTELLAVIAIIAVIAVIAIPSVFVIRRNMNERIYNEKLKLIESAAETYASNNPDIFNAENELIITVGDLLTAGFLEADENAQVVDPTCSGSAVDCSMNATNILLTKQAVGYTAKINGVKCNGETCQGGALALQVCERFKDGRFVGKYGTGANDYCGCKISNQVPTGIYKATKNGTTLTVGNDPVDACIIYGDVETNYLEYNNVTWRVMGVYKIDGNVVAKIITNDTVDDK